MNDGIAVCLGVLRSVFDHLGKKITLVRISDDELAREIRPYGEALGEYFGSLSDEARSNFRKGCRGIQGQTAQRRICEEELHSVFPEFEPPGLMEELELVKARTNERAYPLIQSIERQLQRDVVGALKQEFEGEDRWWYDGIPNPIRKKSDDKRNDEKGEGEREDYFDLLDYKAIIKANWSLFKDSLAFGGKGKDKGTSWIAHLNDMRRIVAHPSKRRHVTPDQLQKLEEIEAWLRGREG